MAFDNLKDAWDRITEKYHQSAGSDWKDYMETTGRSQEDIDAFLDEKDQQMSQLSTMNPDGWEEGQSPTVTFSTPEDGTPLGRWSDPILFSMFAEQALLGVSQKKEVSNFEVQYGPIAPSNLTDMSSMFSLSSLATQPQEVNYMPDNNVLGFKANKEYKSPSDILGYQAGWGWDPTTSRYEARSWDGGNVTFSDTPHSFASPGTAQSGLAPPSASVGTQWIPSTDYYDSIHTRNAISDTFGGPVDFFDNTGANGFTLSDSTTPFTTQFNNITGLNFEKPDSIMNFDSWNVGGNIFPGPVDFMSGVNSYYSTLNPAVPGFTLGFGISKLGDNPATDAEIETNYELGLPSGYAYGVGKAGNSRYIQSDGTIISTGTHTDFHNNGLSFTNTDGDTGVDFLDAVRKASYSSHTHWASGTGSLSGFDIGFNTNTPGQTFGSSKYQGMMDETLSGLTGTIYSGRLENIYTTAANTVTFGDTNLQNFMIASNDYTQNDGFMEKINVLSGSNYMGMPIGADDTARFATSWDPSTSYYDSNYTINSPTSTNIWGGVPTSFSQQTASGVNFISPFNRSSYGAPHSFVTDGGSGSDSRFTTYYNPSFPGGYSVNTPNGESQLLTQLVDNNGTVLSNRLEDVYTTTGGSTNTFGAGVDFMSGKSLHEASLANSASISGFDLNIDGGYPTSPNSVWGGWTVGNPQGDSKLINMVWTDPNNPNAQPTLLTSLWSGYDTDANGILDNLLNFPGPIGNFQLYNGNMSDSNYDGISDDPLSRTWNPSTSYYDSVNNARNYPARDGYGNQTNTGASLVLDLYTSASSMDIESGEKSYISKGLNMRGSDSYQFDRLYNTDHTVNTTAADANGTETTLKYLGQKIDGSDIVASEHFNLSSNEWVVNPNRVAGTGKEYGLGVFEAATAWLSQEGSIGGGWSQISWDFGVKQATERGTVNEPYVIQDVGSQSQKWTDQYFPTTALQDDTERVGKFLSSQMGELFIANQNLLGTFQQYQPLYDPSSTMLNVMTPSEGLGTIQVNFRRDAGTLGGLANLLAPVTYTEWLDVRAGEGGFDQVGEVVQSAGRSFLTADATYAEKETTHKPFAFSTLDWLTGDSNSVMSYFDTDIPKAKDPAGIDKTSGISSMNNVQKSVSTNAPLGDLGKGDIYTIFPIQATDEFSSIASSAAGMNSSTHGMPFYFKDLRDKNIIFFRAYITGLSETISPSWNSETYIGRSEPVYTYSNAEREVNFSLRLAAQTKDELNMIYVKLNRLTSLAYPEYHQFEDPHIVENDEGEEVASIDSKVMMKPPMMKFRLGELFGSSTPSDATTPHRAEAVGFIKSLSYSYPDESPWEIQEGYRVPKIIDVEMGIQVIHSTVPNYEFAKKTSNAANQETFYGITKRIYDKHMNNAMLMKNRPTPSPSL